MVYRVVEKASMKIEKQKKASLKKDVQEATFTGHASTRRSVVLGKLEGLRHKATPFAKKVEPANVTSFQTSQQKHAKVKVSSVYNQATEKNNAKSFSDIKGQANCKAKTSIFAKKCPAKLPLSTQDAQRKAALRAIQFLNSCIDNEKVADETIAKQPNVSFLHREKIGIPSRFSQSRTKVAEAVKLDGKGKVENQIPITDESGSETKLRRLPLNSERIKSLKVKSSSVNVQPKQRVIGRERRKIRTTSTSVNKKIFTDKKHASASLDSQLISIDEHVHLKDSTSCSNDVENRDGEYERSVQNLLSLPNGSSHAEIPNSTAEKVVLPDDLAPLLSESSTSTHIEHNTEEFPLFNLNIKKEEEVVQVEVTENGKEGNNYISSGAVLTDSVPAENSALLEIDSSLKLIESSKVPCMPNEAKLDTSGLEKTELIESFQVADILLPSDSISEKKVTSLIIQDNRKKSFVETLPVFTIRTDEGDCSKSSKNYQLVNSLRTPPLKSVNHNMMSLDISSVKANSYLGTPTSRGLSNNCGTNFSRNMFSYVHHPQFANWGKAYIHLCVDPEIPTRRNYTECVRSRNSVQQRIWSKNSASNDPDRILNATTDLGTESLREYIHRVFFQKRIEMSFSHERGRKLFVEFCSELWKQRQLNFEAEYRRNYDRAKHGLPNGMHILNFSRSNNQHQVIYSRPGAQLGLLSKEFRWDS